MEESTNKEIADPLLAGRIRKGDKKAFDLLYYKFSQQLYGFAFSMLKNHEDAREIVQETFFRIWAKRSQLNSSQSVKAFLFSISYHLTIDLIRKRLKEEQFRNYLQEQQYSTNEPSTENLAGYHELNNILQKAIDELPDQRKKIYCLSREEGLSHKEIAKKMDITVKTVENQINLALRHLRKRLNSQGLLSLLFTTLFL